MMGALTANKDTQIKDGSYVAHPVKADTKIFAGGLVMVINSTNNAEPAADTANGYVVGVACDVADNTGGSAGDINVTCRAKGRVLLVHSGATGAKIGATVYVVDDQTVSSAATTNSVVGGVIAQVVSSTSVWVDISRAL
jgi:hypothetical protein